MTRNRFIVGMLILAITALASAWMIFDVSLKKKGPWANLSNPTISYFRVSGDRLEELRCNINSYRTEKFSHRVLDRSPIAPAEISAADHFEEVTWLIEKDRASRGSVPDRFYISFSKDPREVVLSWPDSSNYYGYRAYDLPPVRDELVQKLDNDCDFLAW